MTRGLATAAVACVAALTLAACSSGDSSGDVSDAGGEVTTTTLAPNQYFNGPVVEAAPNPLGLKWSWKNFATFQQQVISVAGGTTFYEVDWCEMEPTRGSVTYDDTDEIVEAAQRLGYEIYLKLRVGSCWATGSTNVETQGAPKVPSEMPLDLDAYAAWVTETVRHYSARDVHTYAIENEVNTKNQWAPGAADYATLLARGAAAVRAGDPSAKVADSGLASIGYGTVLAADQLAAGDGAGAVATYSAFYARRIKKSGSGGRFVAVGSVPELGKELADDDAVRNRSFFDVTVAAAAAKQIDVWQLHYYEPEAELAQVVAWVRQKAPAQAIGGWELGVAWPGDDYDPAQHAVETTQLFAGALALGVQPDIYLPEAFSPDARDNEIWRGLWEPSGTPRPAASAFTQLAHATSGDGNTFAQISTPALTGLAVGKGDKSTLVVWSASGQPSTLTLAGSLEGATASDIDGRPLPPGAAVTVGASPVYLDAAVAAPQAVAALG